MKIRLSRNPACGFTIIELIVVIATLGILSAVAFSRFLGVSDEANLAVVQQTAAAFQQSAQQARIKWQLQGHPQGSSANQGPQVDLGGTLVRVDPALGYPVGDAGTDTVDAMSLNDCITVFNNLLLHDFTLRKMGPEGINFNQLPNQLMGPEGINFDQLPIGLPEVGKPTFLPRSDSRFWMNEVDPKG